jgi:hypothetical protein
LKPIWFQPGNASQQSSDASILKVASWNDLLNHYQNLSAKNQPPDRRQPGEENSSGVA